MSVSKRQINVVLIMGLCLIITTCLWAQTEVPGYEMYSGKVIPDRMDKKYFTDENGIVRMYVNIWGHVSRPGSFLVYEGIDLVTLFSICGGPKQGANLSTIKLIREEPDDTGEMIYEIDFKNFVTTGDRSQMVRIKPNDTIIIAEKTGHYVISKASVLNTLLQMINIYLQIQRYN